MMAMDPGKTKEKGFEMRLIAALAAATIFLGGCDGNGTAEEDSRTEAAANNTEEEDADAEEGTEADGESGEEAEQE